MLFSQYLINIVIFSAILIHSSFAEVPTKKCAEEDWSCHQDFYLTAGYALAYVQYTKHLFELTPVGQQPIDYTTADTLPNALSGMRLGFGSTFRKEGAFGYELAYNQFFYKSKKRYGIISSYENKSFTADVSYSFNPKDRLTTRFFSGVAVLSNYVSIERPSTSFTQSVNYVDVDPYVGAVVIYYVNAKFALKIEEIFDIAAYNRAYNQAFVTFLSLNYYPNQI